MESGPSSRESSLLKYITHKNLNHRIHSICWLPASGSEDEFPNLQKSSVFRWHFFFKPTENYSFDLQKAKDLHLLCYCRVEETIRLLSTLHVCNFSPVFYIDHQGNATFKERQGRSDDFANISGPSKYWIPWQQKFQSPSELHMCNNFQ